MLGEGTQALDITWPSALGLMAQKRAPGPCHTTEGRLPLEVGSVKLMAEGRCVCGPSQETVGVLGNPRAVQSCETQKEEEEMTREGG